MQVAIAMNINWCGTHNIWLNTFISTCFWWDAAVERVILPNSCHVCNFDQFANWSFKADVWSDKCLVLTKEVHQDNLYLWLQQNRQLKLVFVEQLLDDEGENKMANKPDCEPTTCYIIVGRQH